MHSFGVNPRIQVTKFVDSELETMLYHTVQKSNSILNHLSMTHECGGWTDIIRANAVLNYVYMCVCIHITFFAA